MRTRMLNNSQDLTDLRIPPSLVNACPSMDGSGIILHIRELEGKHTHLDINDLLNQTGASSASKVNVLEENIEGLNGEIHIDHFETVFIKLELD